VEYNVHATDPHYDIKQLIVEGIGAAELRDKDKKSNRTINANKKKREKDESDVVRMNSLNTLRDKVGRTHYNDAPSTAAGATLSQPRAESSAPPTTSTTLTAVSPSTRKKSTTQSQPSRNDIYQLQQQHSTQLAAYQSTVLNLFTQSVAAQQTQANAIADLVKSMKDCEQKVHGIQSQQHHE
jgi:hypothetical protein